MPRRTTGDVSDAFGQFAIFQPRCFWFEPSELVKLFDGARHHETPAGIVVTELIFVRNNPAVFVAEYRPIGEGQCVLIVIEIGAGSGAGRGNCDNDRSKNSPTSLISEPHHESINVRNSFSVRQNCQGYEIFCNAFSVVDRSGFRATSPNFCEGPCPD